MRVVRAFPEAWPLHSAFVISRGSRTEARVVVVEIEQQGLIGRGECTPYPHYHESEESVLAQIASVIAAIEQGADSAALQQLLSAGAARNALDSALWDLNGQLTGKNIWQASGISAPEQIVMAQTVSIGTPEVMAQAALALQQQGASLLKIKMDDHLVTERLMAIRTAVPDATLIVDANESWQPAGLAARCQFLADIGIAMLEQPLPASDDSVLENFIHPLPICADESCHTRDDLPRLVGRYDMVNIKLDKTGGLTEALALAYAARSQGFEIMLGCMLCTSLAISAALPLATLAKFIDLDGPTWLAKDRPPALDFHCGGIQL